MRDKIEAVLDKTRPGLRADGGDVELVDVTEDGIVKLRLTGACHGCPMSKVTLHNWIERELKDNVPEVTGVEEVQ
ncbi:MAG: NifU family protein [bacterium]